MTGVERLKPRPVTTLTTHTPLTEEMEVHPLKITEGGLCDVKSRLFYNVFPAPPLQLRVFIMCTRGMASQVFMGVRHWCETLGVAPVLRWVSLRLSNNLCPS